MFGSQSEVLGHLLWMFNSFGVPIAGYVAWKVRSIDTHLRKLNGRVGMLEAETRAHHDLDEARFDLLERNMLNGSNTGRIGHN